jgi:hypothetical protein
MNPGLPDPRMTQAPAIKRLPGPRRKETPHDRL